LNLIQFFGGEDKLAEIEQPAMCTARANIDTPGKQNGLLARQEGKTRRQPTEAGR
jgi:hypothetical protein